MTLKSTKIQSFIALSDVISLLNMTSGFLSIVSTINHDFYLASIFMLFALMFDSVDGWVARKINRNDELGFGKNIDSLSDVISFAAAPGIFIYTIGTTISNSPYILTTLVSLLIFICGVLRLTRYNAIADHINFNGFIGFPIPGIAVILSAYYLTGAFDIYIALILMTVVSLFMISNFKYPKLDNKLLIGAGAILIILIILNIPLTIANISIPPLILLIITLYCLIIGLIKK